MNTALVLVHFYKVHCMVVVYIELKYKLVATVHRELNLAAPFRCLSNFAR